MDNEYSFEFIPPGLMKVGKCSRCEGPMCIHVAWGSVTPEYPKCRRCGRISNHAKEIDWPTL